MDAALVTTPVPPVPFTTATTANHSVPVGGVQLFYREAGPKDAPTIVLLHGYPSSSRMWNSLIPLLADRYHPGCTRLPGLRAQRGATP